MLFRSNIQGFNPHGTSVTVYVEDQAGTTTPYLLPGLVETWANPKAAHTILPTSGDLGDGTITAVTLALLDGMRCGGLTVTSDGTQGSCIQPASATLQNLSAADVGFFAEDGYVDVGLWWNTNLDAIGQNEVVYLNPVTAHYAYCASTTCTQAFPSSEPSQSDLYDAPGSCYAQGADRTVTARGIYYSPLFGVDLVGSQGIFECPTPVNLSQYSAKRADAFLRAHFAARSVDQPQFEECVDVAARRRFAIKRIRLLDVARDFIAAPVFFGERGERGRVAALRRRFEIGRAHV